MPLALNTKVKLSEFRYCYLLLHCFNMNSQFAVISTLSFTHICYFKGTYKVEVTYGGVQVKGSPFAVKFFDMSKIRIQGIEDGVVGKESTFTGLHSYYTSLQNTPNMAGTTSIKQYIW